MKCEDCPYAMLCFSGKLLTPVVTPNGLAKLCLYCERLVITYPNGKQSRFRCELRPVTKELIRKAHNEGKVVPDPGPTDKYIETIQCAHCQQFLVLKGAYGSNYVFGTDDRFARQKQLIMEVVNTDGTENAQELVFEDDGFTT